MEDETCLRDSEHYNKIGVQLYQFYKLNLHFDTVLIDRKGNHLQVHKLILFASSEYFHNVLWPDRGSLQLDVSYGILEKLVEFLYTGELQVAPHEWEDILVVAKSLQITHLVHLLQIHQPRCYSMSTSQTENLQIKVEIDEDPYEMPKQTEHVQRFAASTDVTEKIVHPPNLSSQTLITDTVRGADCTWHSGSGYQTSEFHGLPMFFAGESPVQSDPLERMQTQRQSRKKYQGRKCARPKTAKLKRHVVRDTNIVAEGSEKPEKISSVVVAKRMLKKQSMHKEASRSVRGKTKCVASSLKSLFWAAQNIIKKYSFIKALPYFHINKKTHNKSFLCRKCPHFFKCYNQWKAHNISFHLSSSKRHNKNPLLKIITTKTEQEPNSEHLKLDKRDIPSVPSPSSAAPLQCPECGDTYVYRVKFRNHLVETHGYTNEQLCKMENIWTRCGVGGCSFAAASVKDMTRHMKLFHPHVYFDCPLCQRHFRTQFSLNKHMLCIHRERKKYLHTCCVCGKTFAQKTQKRGHEKVQHGIDSNVKVHECPVEGCSYTTVVKYNLQQHISKHSKEKNVPCQYCGAKFKCQQYLNRHLNSVHLSPQPATSLLCQVCGAEFKTKGTLQIHLDMMHSDCERFKCHKCPFESKRKIDLSNHLYQMHGFKADFEKRDIIFCDQCPDYSTLSAARMRRHIITSHSELRQFACQYCEKTYKDKRGLRTHQSYTHTETKSFKCTQCDYSGKTASSLTKHQRHQHLFKDVKPYVCAHCPYRSSICGNTRIHIRTKHPGMEVKVVTDEDDLAKIKLVMAEQKKLQEKCKL
ncbi:zinc finger protein 729-like [Haliotis rubra]|uniref:zinc finger protein 729-like n=1 Tax=Haliotis rubra TaxID=36100 RepID=UPI001EE51D96|nr:zinc finger protein 729-like [Haliotis rubra]XP_046565517.1 zinc finger protein 729-like [Haliotis rubra]